MASVPNIKNRKYRREIVKETFFLILIPKRHESTDWDSQPNAKFHE